MIIKQISSLEELKQCKTGDKIQYQCKNCNSPVYRRFRPDAISNYSRFLCKTCEIKETNLKLHGDPNYTNRKQSAKTFKSRSDEEKQRTVLQTKQTKLEKYGDPSYNNPEKMKQTCIERYGSENYAQTTQYLEMMSKYRADHPEINHNRIESDLIRNNGEYFVQTNEFKEKSAKTRYKRYGNKNYTNREKAKLTYKNKTGYDTPFENPEIINKCNETILEKFHNKTYCGSSDYNTKVGSIVSKMKESNISKFGVDSFSKTDEFKQIMSYLWSSNPEMFIHSNGLNKFIYQGLSFDSIPEFCVYLFCISNWIPIVRNYSIGYEYTDVRGKTHITYPDFIINGQMVEIKGGHFFKEDGTMYLPFRNLEWSDEEYEYQSSVYESKRQCLIKNKVLILKDTDQWVQNCINWVKSIEYANGYYGVRCLSRFTMDDPESICFGYTPFNSEKSEYQKPITFGITPFDIQQGEIK